MIISMAAKKRNEKKQAQVTVNKKAYHIYRLEEKFEAGILLLGSEVKSLRNGHADLSAAYARIQDEQCWLIGANISQYEQAGIHNHEPLRKRKLLLHRSEIRKLKTKLDQRGFTLVPLSIYFNNRGLAKIELALAAGKRQYDKRKAITDRQHKRDLDRDMKKYHR
jgi:SsrA-binding protein